MSKPAILFAVFQFLFFTTYAQYPGKFILNGTIADRKSGKLYLIYSTKNRRTIDSADISNGNFIFRGSIDEPTKAELTDNLSMKENGYENYFSDFYIEQGSLKLAVSNNHFAEAKVIGSTINKEYRRLTGSFNPIFKRIGFLRNQAVDSGLETGILPDSINFYHDQLTKFLLDFIEDNQDSFVGLIAFQRLGWLGSVNDDTMLKIFNSLSLRIRNTPTARKHKQAITNSISSSINHVAPDFRRKDVHGKLVSLSSVRGKYVLLDFWASWCLPCRVQTPHIRQLYKKYSKKGLNVIAISCDSKYDAWQKAIHTDSTELFTNILSFTDADMNFLKLDDNVGAASWKGELRKLYNLMPIPTYILIDPKGIIIGRYGGGERMQVDMLDKQLSEIFEKEDALSR